MFHVSCSYMISHSYSATRRRRFTYEIARIMWIITAHVKHRHITIHVCVDHILGTKYTIYGIKLNNASIRIMPIHADATDSSSRFASVWNSVGL